MNNQRQIAFAIEMYMQDNEGTCFPDPGQQPYTTNLDWYGINDTVYDCRLTRKKGKAASPEYGVNGDLFGKKRQDIAKPEETLLLGELAPDAQRGNYAFTIADLNSTRYLNQALEARHYHSLIVAYADGHIAIVPVETGIAFNVALLSKATEQRLQPDPAQGNRLRGFAGGTAGAWYGDGASISGVNPAMDGDEKTEFGIYPRISTRASVGAQGLSPRVIPTRVRVQISPLALWDNSIHLTLRGRHGIDESESWVDIAPLTPLPNTSAEGGWTEYPIHTRTAYRDMALTWTCPANEQASDSGYAAPVREVEFYGVKEKKTAGSNHL
jgi:hypothetical protein